MCSENRFNFPSILLLLAIVIIILLFSSCINTADAAVAATTQHHHLNNLLDPDLLDPDHHGVRQQQQLSQARKLKKAVVPLMLGVLLKVSSIVPMKLMIMSLFALISLLASKFALLLAFATGMLQDKSGPTKRIVAISDSSLPFNHHDNIQHGSTLGAAQFSSFGSSGDGAAGSTGFDTVSLGSNTAATSVDDTPIIQSAAHKRRRIHNMIL